MREIMNKGVEEALVSDDPTTRIIARGMMSAWAQHFQAWVDDELQRGTNPASLMIAIMDIQIMIHSSIVANFLDPSGFKTTAEGYKQLIDIKYERHATQCQEELTKLRGGQA